MSTKRIAATQGIVASENLGTVYQREIFFQVDPADLDWMDHTELADLFPSGMYLDFDPEEFLQYLPPLEAEIFWLAYSRKKNQKDIAKLLELSQPTVSYRYRRTLVKLSYLMILITIDPRPLINQIPFLKERERNILFDLLFYTNQEMVGKKYGIRQSSVKWIFVKTKRRLGAMERKEPEKWANHLGLLLLLEKNLNIRVLH